MKLKANYRKGKPNIVKLFVGCLVRNGNKSRSERIRNEVFIMVRQQLFMAPIVIFEKAIENLKPEVTVKIKKIGGILYKIPCLLPTYQQYSFSNALVNNLC